MKRDGTKKSGTKSCKGDVREIKGREKQASCHDRPKISGRASSKQKSLPEYNHSVSPSLSLVLAFSFSLLDQVREIITSTKCAPLEREVISRRLFNGFSSVSTEAVFQKPDFAVALRFSALCAPFPPSSIPISLINLFLLLARHFNHYPVSLISPHFFPFSSLHSVLIGCPYLLHRRK